MRNYLKPALLLICLFGTLFMPAAFIRGQHDINSTDSIDKLRDRDLQPERIMDAIGLQSGLSVGEAGAGYGYFTFKLSKRVGGTGIVFANDIASEALRQIEMKCRTNTISNIKTVLGKVDDPMFPENDLDMVIVFDCLFEFSNHTEWMSNTKNYLKPDGTLVIVDPDPSRFLKSDHFLTRKQILAFASDAGYAPTEVNDSFLKSHMIIVLKPEK